MIIQDHFFDVLKSMLLALEMGGGVQSTSMLHDEFKTFMVVQGIISQAELYKMVADETEKRSQRAKPSLSDANEVGLLRYCPACARPIMGPEYSSENQESSDFEIEAPRCSGCERPWIACPCSPDAQGVKSIAARNP